MDNRNVDQILKVTKAALAAYSEVARENHAKLREAQDKNEPRGAVRERNQVTVPAGDQGVKDAGIRDDAEQLSQADKKTKNAGVKDETSAGKGRALVGNVPGADPASVTPGEAAHATDPVASGFHAPNANPARTHDVEMDLSDESLKRAIIFALANHSADSQAMHDAWTSEHRADGWKYGQTLDEKKKEHPAFTTHTALSGDWKMRNAIIIGIVRAFENGNS